HQLHAGQNQIACRYCHVGVGEGPHASIPSVNTCMNCHSLVKTGSPEIKKIKAAWDSGEPIKWVKVHDLPDHARFSHTPHTNFGLDCTECHGQVNTMEVVAVQNPFNMGWCVNCHRQPEYNAPVDCVTCHY
ncbi:MAG: cytochrome c3 family protein, partial [Myxococcota bacterium]